jgi:hypothetical protein
MRFQPPGDDYSRAIDRVLASSLRAENPPEPISVLVARLKERPLLANSKRCAYPGVVRQLLAEAEVNRFPDITSCAAAAELAYLISTSFPREIGSSLRILSTAELGNAKRVLGDFREASRLIGAAVDEAEYSADPFVMPEVLLPGWIALPRRTQTGLCTKVKPQRRAGNGCSPGSLSRSPT